MSTTRNSTVRRSARERAVYLGKRLARRLVWAPSDLLHRLRGDGLPPRGLSFVGRGDFEAVGREFTGYFRELGGLAPQDRVLDMGCGIGRMALPLTGYLEDGSYAGFDVSREMTRWCSRNITPKHPNFEFSWVPVYNGKYNPFGTISGSEFRFPFESSTFDFAFATSLFTHLGREDVRHYLAEAARVLKPGAGCLFTFFILTAEAEREMGAGRASLSFVHPLQDGARAIDPRQPEEAIAYPLADVRSMLAEAGLEVREPVHPGLWANAPGGLTLQDIVVARRAA